MTRLNTYLISAGLALSVLGCASTPKQVQSIEDARLAIQQAESSPLAGDVAAKEIDEAHIALREAEKLHSKHRSTSEVDNAAYVAKRHAQIAEEQIAVAVSKKDVEQSARDRQAILLNTREHEAQQATAEANAAKTQAINARDAALSAQQEAEQAKMQADQERERNAMLQKELSDLNAKKTDRGYVLTLGDVLFDTGKATLKPGAMSSIDRLATFLKDAKDRSVMIEGHTDNVGSDDYNQGLSERRAQSVQHALMDRGVPSDRVSAVGKGESYPVASNDSAGGRQQNRRVEIVIENPARNSATVSSTSE